MTTNPWLPSAPQTSDARLRLFCLPYAGGGALLFRPWAGAAPRDIQICAVQLPGREHRLMEPAFTRMDALIPALRDAIAAHLDRPFAIFGHSMGALMAFELTRALRRAGVRLPQQLFLSAHRAPQLPDRRAPIHTLPDEQLWEQLRRLDGTPEEVLANRELMELITPTLRADFELCETFELAKEPPLDIPFRLFGGTEDPNVDEPDLEAWREHTTAALRVSMLPGGHLFLQQQQREVFTAILHDLRSAPVS